MLRSRRLLGVLHALRRDRLEAARSSAFYRPMEAMMAAAVALRGLSGDGLLEVAPLEAFVAGGFPAVAADVGVWRVRVLMRVMASVPTGEVDDGRVPSEGERAAWTRALAEALVDQRLASALAEVVRRLAARDHRGSPCWPEAYRTRGADASSASRRRAGVPAGEDRRDEPGLAEGSSLLDDLDAGGDVDAPATVAAVQASRLTRLRETRVASGGGDAGAAPAEASEAVFDGVGAAPDEAAGEIDLAPAEAEPRIRPRLRRRSARVNA